jgi:hypothetical protein
MLGSIAKDTKHVKKFQDDEVYLVLIDGESLMFLNLEGRNYTSPLSHITEHLQLPGDIIIHCLTCSFCSLNTLNSSG